MRIANMSTAASRSETWEKSITAMCRVTFSTTCETHYKKSIWAGVAVRVQVKKTRFRIPDVTVMLGSKPAERVIRKPPIVAVEVLSPDDRAGYLEEKINDYLEFGVPYIWVINPETRRAYVHTPEGSHEVTDGVLRAESAEIDVAAVPNL